ncbi:hypothetical protein GALL_256260 [mine drainage metagenome]|uniref:Uncharacterized protein n=1 Tax=mine drainage metagenome TaxID=410659 RepID=A0A1J5RWA6_9ZZZZ
MTMAHIQNLGIKGSNSKYSQKGAALILLVFMVALIFTTFLIRATTGVEYRVSNDLKTAKALVEAKSALLGWSVLQSDPGKLPCPEDTSLIGFATEGQAQPSCVLPAIGRLPWRTLGIGDIRDGNNDKLWYVVSNGFRTAPINVNTSAQLSVNGIPNSAVAIIFSSGTPLGTQSRPTPTSSTPPDISQYLDLVNNNGTGSFVTTGGATVFNDRLMVITKTELFSLVTQRVLREVRGDSSQGLVKYYADVHLYPYADTDNNGYAEILQNSGTPSYQGGTDSLFFSTSIKNTLSNNGWYPLIAYQVSPGRQSVSLTLDTKTIVVTP